MIEIESLLPMLLMMQILPSLTGSGGDVASSNTVLLPVAIGHLTINPGNVTLPIGVEKDRRTERRDRRNMPGTGRRMEDRRSQNQSQNPYEVPYNYNGTFGYNGT